MFNEKDPSTKKPNKFLKLGAIVALGGVAALGTAGCAGPEAKAVPSKAGTVATAEATPTPAITTPETTAPVTPGTPETLAAVGKYDSSETANMTPEQITQYYRLPAGDINNPIALMNDYTAINEGIANIGCSKLVWDKYGGDAHADVNAVGDQIVTDYVNPAMEGVFGSDVARDPSFPRLVAISCNETRTQTIIDQIKRPDFHVSDVADTATLKVTKNLDGAIESMSWSVSQSDNLDPVVAKGMGWNATDKRSATISYAIGALQVKKGTDGSSYLEVGAAPRQ